MNNPEFVILDSSIKYMHARNVLEEGLFYCDNNTWSRNLERAVKYSDSNSAVDIAKKLQAEENLPKRVLLVQRNGNNINVGDVKF